MKHKLLAILAVGLLAGPIAAQAVPVTISGTTSSDGTWEITTVTGTYSDLQDLLTAQEWWGDDFLASSLALALGGLLGYPNFQGSLSTGPMFASSLDLTDKVFGFAFFTDFSSLSLTVFSDAFLDDKVTYAIASRVAVPEPGAVSLFGLGLAALGFSHRRKRQSTQA